jgi:hypothetical protein
LRCVLDSWRGEVNLTNSAYLFHKMVPSVCLDKLQFLLFCLLFSLCFRLLARDHHLYLVVLLE